MDLILSLTSGPWLSSQVHLLLLSYELIEKTSHSSGFGGEKKKKLFRNWLVNGHILAYISLTLTNSGSLFAVFFFFVYLWQSVDSATSVACSCISDLEFRHLCAINSPKAIIASNNCVKLYTALFVFTICHTFYNLLQSCLFGGQHFTLEKACNNSLFYCVFGWHQFVLWKKPKKMTYMQMFVYQQAVFFTLSLCVIMVE